ncbi:MAG: hypothetical protein A2X31_08465 [Elusimicrobia bacterium GWB2_63_22]|nr:MAG: hypothetical protein A2X31_08465 [Elusimicrobia bacterium GWB2_63_22]
MQQKIGRAYILAAVSGLLLAGAFAPFGLGGLAWVALVPLFYAVTVASGVRQAFLLGGTTGLVFYILALSWMPNVVHYLALLFWLVFALWLALHAGLLRALWDLLHGRGGLGSARALAWAAAAGLSWAGIEYFRSELWPLECPWLGLGYSQTYNPVVFQSLSLIGVYGLSAFIAAFNAALTLLPRRRPLLAPAALAALALAAAYAWGAQRLSSGASEGGRPIKAALVQAERADINTLARLSLRPEAADADLLVWPECSVTMPSVQEPAHVSLLARKLKKFKGEAVIGVCVDANRARGVKRGNYALVLGRDKRTAGLYHKMHPVQFVEAGLPSNKKPEPVVTPLGRLGPQICYDLAFEDGTRAITRGGAEVLITPTLDPEEWSLLQHQQHSDMSAARAVESGLWLLRAASSGESQVIDSLGQVRASLASGREGVLVAEARLAPGGTFYTSYGWLLPPFSFIFTLAAAALVILRKVR